MELLLKNHKLLFALLLALFITPVYSQNSLYIPLEFQKAYDKGTRSMDGKPGINYWQNHSDYIIDARVSTQSRTLSGTETITYYNESNDTLKEIIIRLYQDINRPENSRDWNYDPKSFTEGVQINKIKIEGTDIDIGKTTVRTGTNLKIQLDNFLNPKSHIELYFDWSFSIPAGDSPRMGIYDSTSYLIAYWYPQIAVYDDIDGWDKLDYRGQVEFYNDHSNFDVNITVDNVKCMVWATGILQNPEEIFGGKYLTRYKSNLDTEDEIANFINSKNQYDPDILQKSDKLIWHYKADYVPDFAFGFSDHYYWDFTYLEVEPGRKIRINTVYNPQSEDFKQVCDIARDAIKYLSTEIPGVPFPYPSMTVFNGEGGMEFPMMVNDSKEEKYSADVYLTSHEISHTYFPFYMGTNERKYAWMDEGWAVFLPSEFQTKKSNNEVDSRARFVKSYSNFSGTLYDVPMMMVSHQLKSPSYRNASYAKAACAYQILYNILGDELFQKCLREFINRWNGKHPTPFDFFFTFNDVLAKSRNLDWFWKPWFFEFGFPDLSIQNVKIEKGEIKITVRKIGNYPVPVFLTLLTVEGKEINLEVSAEIWNVAKNNEFTYEKEIKENIVSVILGNKYIPDINPDNNKFLLNK
jgi:hypothetical protein